MKLGLEVPSFPDAIVRYVVERLPAPEQLAVAEAPPEAVAEAQVTVTAPAGTVLQLALPPPNHDPLEATRKVQVVDAFPPVRFQVTDVAGDPAKVPRSGSEVANETVPGETAKEWMLVASGLTMAGVGWRGGFWPAIKPAPAIIATASKHPQRLMRTSMFPARAASHAALMVKVTVAV